MVFTVTSVQQFVDAIGQRFVALRRGADNRAVRRVTLAIALAVFVVMAVVAFRGLNSAGSDTQWWLVVVAGASGTLISQFLNSLEFREIGRASGTDFSIVDAIRVSLVGSAANLLPVPGSVAVRVAAINRRGARVRRGAQMSLGVGGYFIGTTFVLAGAAQVIVGRLAVGCVWVVIGVAAAAIAAWLLRPAVSECRWDLHVRVVVIEAALIAAGGIRMWLVLVGLGFEVAFSQTVGLTVAGAVTTAVGFFPAGLGLREGLVAAVSPLVGLAVAAGLAAAVIDRFFRMLMLGLVAIALLIGERSAPHSASYEPDLT